MDVAHTVAQRGATQRFGESDIIARRLFTHVLLASRPGEPLSRSLLLALFCLLTPIWNTIIGRDGLIRLISLGLLEYEATNTSSAAPTRRRVCITDGRRRTCSACGCGACAVGTTDNALGRAPFSWHCRMRLHLRHTADAALAQGHPSVTGWPIAMGQHLQCRIRCGCRLRRTGIVQLRRTMPMVRGVACYLQGIIARLRGNELQSLMLMEEG